MSEPVTMEEHEFRNVVNTMKEYGNYSCASTGVYGLGTSEKLYVLLKDGKLDKRVTLSQLKNRQIAIFKHGTVSYNLSFVRNVNTKSHIMVALDYKTSLSMDTFRKVISYFYKVPILALSSTGIEYDRAFYYGAVIDSHGMPTFDLIELDGFTTRFLDDGSIYLPDPDDPNVPDPNNPVSPDDPDSQGDPEF